MTEWINISQKLPGKKYSLYLCRLITNDYGEHICSYQVLYYNFFTKEWCYNDPSSCEKGKEQYLSNWYSVTHWMPVVEPTE